MIKEWEAGNFWTCEPNEDLLGLEETKDDMTENVRTYPDEGCVHYEVWPNCSECHI